MFKVCYYNSCKVLLLKKYFFVFLVKYLESFVLKEITTKNTMI